MRALRSLALLATAVLAACGGSAVSGPADAPGPSPAASPAGPSGAGGVLAPANVPSPATVTLAATPPMGWNDWAHYGCDVSETVVLDNAKALVDSGLAARGYDTVTVDDCWMAGARAPNGDLVADSSKFPHGMAWLGDRLHAMGLKFGIYEDAGSTTCGGYPGSGQPKGGGSDHFQQDANLFASWGVDYLKLDGCNLWVPPGQSMERAYRDAYSAQATALAATGRPIVFSESAPAYFWQSGDPASWDPTSWLSVLGWVGQYGQLWRVGGDIWPLDPWDPNKSRWVAVMTNYGYTRDIGRFTHPGNWNDPDFIIGGDPGLTADEARSQFSLWAMMAAPLILSSDLTQVTQSGSTVSMLGNPDVIAVDQDALGEAATVVSSGATLDVLVKRLANGDRAVAVFNHGSGTEPYGTAFDALGFAACPACTYHVKNLWDGTTPAQISGSLAPHAAALFRVAQAR